LVAFLSSSLGLIVVAAVVVVLATILTASFRRVLVAGAFRSGAGDTSDVAKPETLAALLMAAALVVPTIIVLASSDVFVIPKLTALRVTLVIGLILLVFGRGSRLDSSVLRSSRATRIIDITLVAYVGLTTLATIASIDPAHSLVGEYEQYQGLLTTLLYVAFFYLARVALADGRRLKLLALATIVGATIVAGYAVLQQLGLDPLWGSLYKGSVFSTLGQHEWLGAYLVLCLALGVAALLCQVKPYARLLVALALILIVVALLLSLSRGAYLGIVVATAVFVIALAPRARPNRRWLVALAGAVIALVLIGALPPVRQEAGAVLSRALSTTDPADSSIEGRLDLWKVGLAITVDHPILGTGPETFPLLFPQYRDSLLASHRNSWLIYRPESPHDVYLEISAGAGVPALAAYLALLAAIFLRLIEALRHAPNRAARVMLAAVIAAAAGHLVTDLFMTAELTGSWLFWLVVGAGVGYAEALSASALRSREARSA
jgi:O-antigen ligase